MLATTGHGPAIQRDYSVLTTARSSPKNSKHKPVPRGSRDCGGLSPCGFGFSFSRSRWLVRGARRRCTARWHARRAPRAAGMARLRPLRPHRHFSASGLAVRAQPRKALPSNRDPFHRTVAPSIQPCPLPLISPDELTSPRARDQMDTTSIAWHRGTRPASQSSSPVWPSMDLLLPTLSSAALHTPTAM